MFWCPDVHEENGGMGSGHSSGSRSDIDPRASACPRLRNSCFGNPPRRRIAEQFPEGFTPRWVRDVAVTLVVTVEVDRALKVPMRVTMRVVLCSNWQLQNRRWSPNEAVVVGVGMGMGSTG